MNVTMTNFNLICLFIVLSYVKFLCMYLCIFNMFSNLWTSGQIGSMEFENKVKVKM
jgi:hypothetical protein